MAYRGPNLTPPPPPVRGYGGDPAGQSVRQPIGHESLQTGPNRWEYRPLYADDDGRLDEIHGQIERELRPNGGELASERDGAADSTTRRASDRAAASAPEELPVPRDAAMTRDVRSPANVRGQARDIARSNVVGGNVVGRNVVGSAAFANERAGAATRQQAADEDRRTRSEPPPPPRPDPPRQQTEADEKPPQSTGDPELRGPLLQNPSTGTREF
jgi:hypothetical protein